MTLLFFHRLCLALAIMVCCLYSNSLSAAPSDTLTNSQTLIAEGIKLHDEGKYKEAIALYRQVPEGDTNYAVALNEQAISALSDSSFEEAKKLILQGLALPGKPSRRQFLLLLGHVNDYLGDPAAALHYYDTLLQLNPYDHQPWYEKGAVYLLQKDYNKAMSCFRHSLVLNPNHFRSHLNMGMSLFHQGRFAEAYLALCFSLFATNDASSARGVIGILNDIQQQTDDVIEAWQARNTAHNDPAFNEADAIINAKLALSSEYTFKSLLSGDGTINTLHLILEKVKWDATDTNLVMQYYMPFYKQAFDNGKFDPMVLLMFSGYGINVIERQVKKHTGEVKDFRGDLSAYMDKIAATQVLPYNERKVAPERYTLMASDNLFIVGGVISMEPLKFRQGPVEIYRDGNYGGRGFANAAGNKEGEWIFYYDNGNIRSRETYRDGNEIGESFYYRRNGTLASSYKYNKDGKAMEKREYTYSGVLDAMTKDEGDKAEYISYHRNGTVEYRTHFKNDVVVDPVIRMVYDNGQPSKEIHFDNGKRNGRYKEYNPGGKLIEETEYKDGDREGTSTTYYKSGALHYRAGYHNNKLEGPYEAYNEDGKPIERGEYHNGRKTGTMELLTPEGRVYGSVTYRKDLPVAYRYTDDAGKTLSGAEKNGELNMLVSYHSNGNKAAEVPLRNGKTEGVASYYYSTGSLSKRVTFADDKAEGPVTEYYRNGRKSSETYNHNDGVSGFYTGYTDAGNKRSEGFLEGDLRCGQWRFYYADGKPEEEDFYVNGKKNGPEKNYRGNGTLRYTDMYDRGILEGLIEYDTAGREIYREYFPGGNGAYKMHGSDGKVVFAATLRYGNYEGPYTKYFPDGSVSERGFYKSGNPDSIVEGFHPDGQKHFTGLRRNGEREGVWTFYDDAGVPEHEINYSAGEKEGVEKIWVAGILQTAFYFHNNEPDGREVYYGENNEVAGVLVYKQGILTGYTYAGKDGNELPVMPLKNASGHVVAMYANGRKGVDISFVEGRPEGPALRWYSNGQQAQELQYTIGTGDAEGIFRTWSPSGQMIHEASYHADIINGNERTWNVKGQLVSSTEYSSNGLSHGIYQSIDPATGRKAIVRYYHGVEMSMN